MTIPHIKNVGGNFIIYVFYEKLPLLSQVSTTCGSIVLTTTKRAFLINFASPMALFAERSAVADLNSHAVMSEYNIFVP